MCCLRHREHYARNRTSLAGLEQDLLFFGPPYIRSLDKNEVRKQLKQCLQTDVFLRFTGRRLMHTFLALAPPFVFRNKPIRSHFPPFLAPHFVTKNTVWSTGPLAHPVARSLAPLTHSLVPHYSLHSRALLRSLPRLWNSEWLDGYLICVFLWSCP